MPLVIVLFIATVIFMFLYRRSHSLSRDCRWRARRQPGQEVTQEYYCASCGAVWHSEDGKAPNACRKPKAE
ncbi:hypothetical protein HA397_28570 [Escherichia coli]|nr:hypothetical protein [Escherichia coli]